MVLCGFMAVCFGSDIFTFFSYRMLSAFVTNEFKEIKACQIKVTTTRACQDSFGFERSPFIAEPTNRF